MYGFAIGDLDFEFAELRRPRRICLVFESSLVLRRVFTFPADWRELDAPGLELLSWGR